MEYEHKSDAVLNFAKCLEFAIKWGHITDRDADKAMGDFLQYEFAEAFSRQTDAVLAVQDQVIDTITHAISEGWISEIQGEEAIRCYNLGLYSQNGVDEVT